jgi:hypothetical protein
MPFKADCTVARSPCFAAVASDISLVVAANATLANIVEPSSPARIFALIIAVLPSVLAL